MQKRHYGSKIALNALLLLVLFNFTLADSRSRTPARVLAKQTGATQFEEERFETHTDCNEHKHHLKKRSSDEDVDYEVYQGVVGRPGIDFPIYPRIPKTSFSCRSFGNGYFADMETDCQVFHICEEGRKISFLCPNGTIFQQSELTCDWWFKVNCLGSPGYYAESAEILSKQRVQRVRPSVPVQGFNIVGGGLNIKPKVAKSTPHSRHGSSNKPERRIDSNEEPSLESVDFDDVSGEKQLKGPKNKVISNIDNNSNDNESQIAAESASFVGAKRRNSYTYDKSNADGERKPSESRHSTRTGSDSSRRGNGDRGSQRNGYTQLQANNLNNEPVKARHGQRGQQRFKEEKKPLAESLERSASNESNDYKKPILPEKIIQSTVPVEGTAKSNVGKTNIKSDIYEAQSTRSHLEKTPSTTALYPLGTYSTARRLDSTRTTPYYTPTVPAVVSKSKNTDGNYNKGKGSSGNLGFVVTTPNTNRFNNNAGSILESSGTPKATIGSVEPSTSTYKPIIIGMRHHYDTSPDVLRLSLNSNLNNDQFTTTTPATTGPTYLPKSASSPKVKLSDAAGDLLLFAPSPAEDESVSRNVDEMLKTMSILKDNLGDVEVIKGLGQARAGLEIPPSSGPDALVTLAKYFAAEQSNAGANSLNPLTGEKPTKNVVTFNSSASSKPSDTTVTITTAATPSLSSKADDIKSSLLSEKTVTKYSNLFGLKTAKGKQQPTDLSTGLLSNSNHTNAIGDSAKDNKDKSFTNFPQIGSTDATIRKLAEKPESRKTALVFSNALTTYLEDPKSFREQLVSFRPTEPPPTTDKPNFEVVTESDPTLFNSGTAASYLPKKSTTGIHATTTHANIAAEINNNFDYSTQLPDLTSTTEVFDTTTFKFSSHESGEEEFLQREQTQSFVKSRNNLATSRDNAKKTNAAYKNLDEQKGSTSKTTENPWNHISSADFLDPLTINDGLMKSPKPTTSSTFTYKPRQSTTTSPTPISHGKLQVLSSASQRGNSLHFDTSAEQTTPRNSNYRSHESKANSWDDIFNSYDLPRDTLPSSSGLQRIANKLFGGLNESEALHLKNVMQQAEHDRQVLSLLLLLIQTCDDHNGKALERSRKHLLNALIEMDGKLQNGGSDSKTSHNKLSQTTTTRVPVTTYRRNGGDDYILSTTTSFPPTTTDLPATSTVLYNGSVEETTKFEIRVEDPEEDFTSSTVSSTHSNLKSDKRALELLKSLYSLASKFTSRR